MKHDNYLVIQGWMINKLKLRSNELLIFATIYGFSQDGESQFKGSLQYLCDITSSAKNTVRKALLSLEEKNLIEREIVKHNNLTFNVFRAAIKSFSELSVCEECSEASHLCECETERGGQKLTGSVSERGGAETERGGSEIAPNNTIYNTIDNNSLMSKIKIEDIKEEKDKEIFLIADAFRKRFIENLTKSKSPSAHQKNAKYKAYTDPIRLMMESDGVTKENLTQVWKWLKFENSASDFWKKNILSTSKLRKHIQKLILQSNEQKTKSSAVDKTRDVLNRTQNFRGYV